MNVPFKAIRLTSLFAALVFAPASPARAVVTNLVWYRLGENDPGASNGVAVTNTTVDLIGFENLKQSGGPFYTNGVAAGASNNVGSSLAMQFNGTSQYLSNTVVSTLTDNFGIEAWVKPDTVVGGVNHIIVFDGDTGSSGIGSGWGLYQNGGSFFGALGVFGGLGNVGSGTAVAGTWTHLALVRSGGVATLYVNGVASGSTSSLTPPAAAGGFAIGSFPQAPTGQYFSGSIDEVRVFTFGIDPSTSEPLFSTNDLLFNLKRVTTVGVVSFGTTNATIAGAVYPPGLPTSAWFEWGTTTNYGNVTSPQLFGGQAGGTNFTQAISNLQFSTTYHFHAVVSNSLGVAAGVDSSFTTTGPSVQTLAATGIDSAIATLNATGSPGSGAGNSGWFQWGTSTNYGNTTTAQALPVAPSGYSQGLNGLAGGTTYQFRAILSNSIGVATGSNLSFTTLLPLTVASLPATAVGTDSATLNGTANPGGASTAGYFEYGTTTNYGSATTLQPLGGGTNATNFSQVLTTLTAGQTYHYRADATRNGGIALALGGDQSFTMPTLPAVTTLPAGAVGLSTATLNGSANPQGSATTVWFIWGQSAHTNITAPQAVGAGVTATNFSQAITGLTGGTVYSYQSVASNAAGVVIDPTGQGFTTPSLPVVTTLTETEVPPYALNFDGIDDRVDAGTVPFPIIANFFTMELWANPTASRTTTTETNTGISGTSGQRYAIFPENGGTDFAGAGISIGTNGISVFENQNGYLPSPLVYSAPISGWTHVAVVYSNAQPRLYVNGVLVHTGLTSTRDVRPSANLGGSTSPYGNFQGQLDEVRVWNAPLSQAQIQSNMNRSLTGVEGNLAAYFRCDEGGGTVLGNSALSNPQIVGTLTNGTTFVPSGVLPSGGVSARTATLNGFADTKGLPAGVWFEWGATTNYGNLTPAQALNGVSGGANLLQVLTGVPAGNYQFRMVASNSFGVVHGTNQSFAVPLFGLTVTNLPGVESGSGTWADYDNDGWLDILIAGHNVENEEPDNVLWRNTGGSFTNIALAGIGGGDFKAAWGDYDNDGSVDLIEVGGQFNSMSTRVYSNTINGFALNNTNKLLPTDLSGTGSAAWGDYDNDGRLDILLTGNSSQGFVSQIWRNLGTRFLDVAAFDGVDSSSAAWGDFDNDGRLDFVLTGTTESGPGTNGITQIWRNTGNGFVDINAGLPGVFGGSVAWGDYDNDGRLDLLLTGITNRTTGAAITQVWRNTGSGFSNINANLPGVSAGSAVWGDYDNDGRLDILLYGMDNTGTNFITQVWRNTGSGFSNVNLQLPRIAFGSVAWGDYDNDGRLDILLTGAVVNDAYGGVSYATTEVWRNNTPFTNTPPTAPTGLVTKLGSDGGVTFGWNAATDAQTPSSGLSYNLRVGTAPGAGDLVGPMAAVNGLRRVPQLGNAQMNLFRTIVGLPLGQTIYWSVQAVDTAFAGGPFAPEQSFADSVVFTPSNGIPVPGDVNGDGIVSPSELAGVLANLNGNGIVTESELNLVLSNYFPHSPLLLMTNVAGLGGTNVTFALSNSTAGAFSVEYSTNLVDWQFLGSATPLYEFFDTNAPAIPQRYYRLRWP